MTRVVIHGLYTSPGHNYFGHHGEAAGEHGIVEHDEIELVAGRGIPGDRFFDWKEDYKGQVTLIDRTVIDDIRRHAENPDLPPSAFRRNVVVSGIDLNRLVGRAFRLGDVLLDFPLALPHGVSTLVTYTTPIYTKTVNTAIWTAYNPGPTDLF